MTPIEPVFSETVQEPEFEKNAQSDDGKAQTEATRKLAKQVYRQNLCQTEALKELAKQVYYLNLTLEEILRK